MQKTILLLNNYIHVHQNYTMLSLVINLHSLKTIKLNNLKIKPFKQVGNSLYCQTAPIEQRAIAKSSLSIRYPSSHLYSTVIRATSPLASCLLFFIVKFAFSTKGGTSQTVKKEGGNFCINLFLFKALITHLVTQSVQLLLK